MCVQASQPERANRTSPLSMLQPTNEVGLEMDLNAGFPKKPEAKRGMKVHPLQTRGVDMLEECEHADSDGSVRACRSVVVLEWREV